jgi:SAM-dependent methyltransferase
MDQAETPLPELARSLRDVERLNRLFGGRSALRAGLRRLLQTVSVTGPLTLLDVATGAADLARDTHDWLTRGGREVITVATDLQPRLLALAERRGRGGNGVMLLATDAMRLPLADGSVDVVVCTLALHHLVDGDARQALAEMARVSRHGVVVTDLTRGWPALALVWLATRLPGVSAVTRFDGPASVRAAWRPKELCGLAEQAGLRVIALFGHPWFRLVLVATPSPRAELLAADHVSPR